MCNFSQGFYERGLEEGIEIGVEKGIGIGREEGIGIEIGVEKGIGIGVEIGRKEERVKTKIDSLKAVMEKLKLSFNEACDLLDIPEAEREEYYARITNENNPADSDR